MNLKGATATLVLGAVGLLALAALGWVALIGPAAADRSATAESRIDTQDRNQAMRLELVRLRQQADDLPTTDALTERLDEIFPPTADQPGFFAQVATITDWAGIPAGDVAVISPGVPEVPVDPAAPPADAAASPDAASPDDGTAPPPAASAGTVAVQTVTVEVRGDYRQLAQVLGGIERMKRAFLVSTATVEADEDQRLTLTLVGRTFVAPPLVHPPS